jgi:dinuclear metal center YbgI/SA1388 family protein
MKLQKIIDFLEDFAPLAMQEDYDNSGLQIGSAEVEVQSVLVCLDCSERVVDEAIEKGCNVIISHHPLIFKGLKSITANDPVARVALKCIRNDIQLYAMHTNLDNHQQGVNAEIAMRLGLVSPKILSPITGNLVKLVVFIPQTHHSSVSEALFSAGAGQLGNYDSCQYFSAGTGTFRPLEKSNPFMGKKDQLEHVQEVRAEYLFRKQGLSKIIHALHQSHPYEEVAYDLIPLSNTDPESGAGMIGEFEEAITEKEFLEKVKSTFMVGVVRHTAFTGRPIKRVAFCGGSGSFLLSKAIREKADVYLTSDVKYHDFFNADGRILYVDIGHFESEQFTIELMSRLLKEKFTTFAIHLTEQSTNPINYF